MTLFTRKSPYYHLLQYLLFLLKHPVYIYIYIYMYMLLISCCVDLTSWYTVLLRSCLSSLSFPLCSYSQFAIDILPVHMLNDIKDFVCYPACYFGRLLFSLVKRQTRWRHYLRDVVFPTFYHQNLKIPQISQFQYDHLYYDLSFFYCCTMHFNNIKIPFTNKCTLLLNT